MPPRPLIPGIRSLALGVGALALLGSMPAFVFAADPEPEDPCAGEFTDPVLTDCWECYLHMLQDCDESNPPSGTRREACYKAAQTFYEWCLDRVPKNKADGTSEKERKHTPVSTLEFDVRSEMIFDFDFGEKVVPDDIRVFVRVLNDEDETAAQRVETIALELDEFWPLQDEDGLRIALDQETMREHRRDAVGLAVALVDKDETVRWGMAMPLALEDPFDLDDDGTFTRKDRRLALRRWGVKELETEVVAAMFNAELDED